MVRASVRQVSDALLGTLNVHNGVVLAPTGGTRAQWRAFGASARTRAEGLARQEWAAGLCFS